VTFAQGTTAHADIAQDGYRRQFDPQESRNIDNRTTSQPFALGFASPITRVGFEVRFNTCGSRATVQFFRGGTSVGSAQSGPSMAPEGEDPVNCSPARWLFAAFESSQPFDRIVISVPLGFMKLDNIRFENVAPPPPVPVFTPLANPSSFSAQATLITFEGQGISGPPTIASLSGATFAGGSTAYVSIGMDDRPRPFGPADPKVVDNRPSNSQPISIAFAAPVTRVGFESVYNGCGETVLVEFFSGGTLIGSARTPPSGTMPNNNCSPGNFVFAGFQSNVAFDRIRLTAPVNGYLRLDNLRFER
jgi:hypothetical protein